MPFLAGIARRQRAPDPGGPWSRMIWPQGGRLAAAGAGSI